MVSNIAPTKMSTGPLRAIILTLDKLSIFSRWLNIVAMIALTAMVVFTFADVILRYIFNRAITGSIEIVNLLMVVAVFCGLGYCQSVKGHVVMDIVTSKLKPKSRILIENITILLSMVVFAIIIWQTSLFAKNTSEASTIFNIPAAPQLMLISFTCLLVFYCFYTTFLLTSSRV